MHPVSYGYMRALEFEGRHPHDAGQWGITTMRLLYLEGLPDFDQHRLECNADGTFPRTPVELRKNFWKFRMRFYRRVRESNEAAWLLKYNKEDWLSKACLPLFRSWVNPPEGIIPMPAPEEPSAPETHAIKLLEALRLGGVEVEGDPDALHFLFQNTWGEEWGKNGAAMLPFAYYDKYVFEQWIYYHTREIAGFRSKKLSKGWYATQARDEFDRRLYGFEAGDPDGERLGWAFAIETENGIELEEFFVAPEARGKGIGSRLAEYVVQLVKAKGLPLWVWVPFADAMRESPGTAPALPKLARRLGVTFRPCPVPWAAYLAASGVQGSAEPIEPMYFPGRPKSTMGALAAFAASVGVFVAMPQPELIAETAGITASEPQIALDSPEWDRKNERRAALIRKKNREGLDEHERKEFEELQLMARTLVEAASPAREFLADRLEALLAEKAKQ